VLARQARFLELESAKLVVSRIPVPAALLAPSLSQHELERHPRICILLTSPTLNLLPRKFPAAPSSSKLASGNARERL